MGINQTMQAISQLKPAFWGDFRGNHSTHPLEGAKFVFKSIFWRYSSPNLLHDEIG